MGMPVVTVATGGLPIVESTSGFGTPVTESAIGRGVAVTKVVGKPGLPVIFVNETGGPVTPPVTYVTWEAATVTAVTLSGGNLVATNTGTTSTDQGAHVATVNGKTSGKYYFEGTWTSVVGTGANFGIGVGTTSSTYTGMGQTGGVTGVNYYRAGSCYSNGISVFANGTGPWAAGSIVGLAVDLDNRRIWIRQTPSGTWNSNASYNPATNIGGLTIPAGTMVPFVTFGGSGGAVGYAFTANFGASAFSGAVPSGFTSGWPA